MAFALITGVFLTAFGIFRLRALERVRRTGQATWVVREHPGLIHLEQGRHIQRALRISMLNAFFFLLLGVFLLLVAIWSDLW